MSIITIIKYLKNKYELNYVKSTTTSLTYVYDLFSLYNIKIKMLKLFIL